MRAFCSRFSCTEPHHAKGLCRSHYEQVWRTGRRKTTTREVRVKYRDLTQGLDSWAVNCELGNPERPIEAREVAGTIRALVEAAENGDLYA